MEGTGALVVVGSVACELPVTDGDNMREAVMDASWLSVSDETA